MWGHVPHAAMVCAAEKIAGPYVWGIYDLLLLPPSFPYGGMVRCQTSTYLCTSAIALCDIKLVRPSAGEPVLHVCDADAPGRRPQPGPRRLPRDRAQVGHWKTFLHPSGLAILYLPMNPRADGVRWTLRSPAVIRG